MMLRSYSIWAPDGLQLRVKVILETYSKHAPEVQKNGGYGGQWSLNFTHFVASSTLESKLTLAGRLQVCYRARLLEVCGLL